MPDAAARLARHAQALGFPLDEPVQIGGRYAPFVRQGRQVLVSGQVPRIGSSVVVTGRAGEAVSLDEARRAAQVGALRALVLLRQAADGELARVAALGRLNVFIQCSADFTQHSEVADAASDLLVAVLGPEAGRHARTSVGVWQLPKNATVELDLSAELRGD